MNRSRQVALVLLLISVWGVVRHLHNSGEDLASSYVGCRLLAEGKGDHLYSHSTTNFSDVDDPVWDDMGSRTGFYPLTMLHPYVQTPLWAYSLQPFCTRMGFRPFCDGFYVLFMLCMSGTIWLVARYWTPSLFHPLWIGLAFFALYRTEPFKYAIFLAQTHILYIFMTVLAVILAERRWQVSAGVLLALAASVKITPGFLVIYWLVTRQYKAAITFIAASLALAGLTVLLLGSGLMHAYLQSLAQNSNVLLLAFNNQSFAGWWVGMWSPRSEVYHWYIHRLPMGVKVSAMLLTFATTIFGGWLDRNDSLRSETVGTSMPPYGAVFAILGATLFAPIAWTHYYILLVIPTMLFLEAGRRTRSWGWIACILLIFVLNIYPISFGSVHFRFERVTIIRSQFYSGLIAMAGLALLGYRRNDRRFVLPATPLANV